MALPLQINIKLYQRFDDTRGIYLVCFIEIFIGQNLLKFYYCAVLYRAAALMLNSVLTDVKIWQISNSASSSRMNIVHA